MITEEQILETPKAIEKANALKPSIFRFSHNVFWINGSKGDVYEVVKTSSGQFDCNCQAGNLNKVCYHVAAVFQHLVKAAQQIKATSTQQPKQPQRPRLINFIDMGLLNRSHKDFTNFLDICCTIEISEKAANWFKLPEENRPKLFADFAGI